MNESRGTIRKATPFEPDTVEIEKRPLPAGIRWVLYTVLLFCLLAFIWLYFAKVDVIVRGQGKTVSLLQKIAMGAMERSIVQSIDIQVGQRVHKGQKLAVLDPTVARANVDALTDQKNSLFWQKKRIQAEISKKPFRPDGSHYAAIQQAIHRKHMDEFSRKMESFDEEISMLLSDISKEKEHRLNYKKILEINRHFESVYKGLLGDRITSRNKYLEAVQKRIEAESEVNESLQKIRSLRASLKKQRALKKAFAEKWNRELHERLYEISKKLNTVVQSLNKARHYSSLVVLKAPEDAFVLKVADRDRGSVIRSGEPLMVLTPVPSLKDLEVEAEILAHDRAYIREGDKVKIKFEAFPFQKYGYATGIVRSISKDSALKKQATGARLVYKVRIRLQDLSKLRKLPRDFVLTPGMRVTAEIIAGRRRLYEYVFYPFIGVTSRSFTEP